MKFYSFYDIPNNPGEKLFGYGKIGNSISCLVFGGITAFCIFVAYQGGYVTEKVNVPKGVAIFMAAIIGLMFFMSFSVARASLRPSNWIMRYSPDWIVIKYRSYLNYHLPANDIQAFGFRPMDAEWMRKAKETLKVEKSDGKTEQQFKTYLEIKLSNDSANEIALHLEKEHLAEEEGKKIVKTKHIHYPVQVIEDSILRVQWNGVMPNINKALKILERSVKIIEEKKDHTDFTDLHSLDPKEQEEKILLLARSGEMIKARKLAKKHFNIPLKDSKQWMRERLGAAARKEKIMKF